MMNKLAVYYNEELKTKIAVAVFFRVSLIVEVNSMKDYRIFCLTPYLHTGELKKE